VRHTGCCRGVLRESEWQSKSLPSFLINGISPYTTEPIPLIEDTEARLRGFWDPGHFKKELGDLMLQRAFGSDTPATHGFGVSNIRL
jgi:hypothetical protein